MKREWKGTYVELNKHPVFGFCAFGDQELFDGSVTTKMMQDRGMIIFGHATNFDPFSFRLLHLRYSLIIVQRSQTKKPRQFEPRLSHSIGYRTKIASSASQLCHFDVNKNERQSLRGPAMQSRGGGGGGVRLACGPEVCR